MEELSKLGISYDEYNDMLDINPNISDMSEEEIYEKIAILEYFGCDKKELCNIIVGNPLYLDRLSDDVISFLAYLKSIGFSYLNLLIDSNPLILNMDRFEIKDYIDNKVSNGENIEDIIDELDSKPYLFNEI